MSKWVENNKIKKLVGPIVTNFGVEDRERDAAISCRKFHHYSRCKLFLNHRISVPEKVMIRYFVTLQVDHFQSIPPICLCISAIQ